MPSGWWLVGMATVHSLLGDMWNWTEDQMADLYQSAVSVGALLCLIIIQKKLKQENQDKHSVFHQG